MLERQERAGILPLDDTRPERQAPGFEPESPAAWSGIPDSNWCMQTGSLPSWPLDEYRELNADTGSLTPGPAARYASRRIECLR